MLYGSMGLLDLMGAGGLAVLQVRGGKRAENDTGSHWKNNDE
jgi:hypothetical protein